MDSSVSPTHGEQELSVWNGHYECTCYHPLFVFNQFGDLERCALRPGNIHSADEREGVLKPVVGVQGKVSRIYFRADAGFANPEVYEYLEGEGIKDVIRLPAKSYKSGLATCSRARSGVRRTRCAVPMRTSPIKREPGQSRVASSPRSNGIRANFPRASASSSPTWRGQPRMSSPSTTSAGPASSGSRRARERSDGRGSRAALSPPTPSAFSFMPSPTISATSRAHSPRDQPKDFGEQVSGNGDLSNLERDVAAVANNLRANLDEFLLEARQRPVFDRLWRRQVLCGREPSRLEPPWARLHNHEPLPADDPSHRGIMAQPLGRLAGYEDVKTLQDHRTS
jgi:hypothetical protein